MMAFTVDIPSSNTFDSHLEIPTSGDPNDNAMLTITLRYKLDFADSKNPLPGLIPLDGILKARDAEGFAHPILDWDAKSRWDFTKAFWRGEKIWNLKFLLIAPRSYSGLDFEHPKPGFFVRPNVLCLFHMEPGGNPHRTVTVFRVDRANDPVPFRNHDRLYDDLAPWTPTLGHELGHALGMLHIKALLGDAQCIANHNLDRCYGETDAERANIMGGGRDLWRLNAAPWLDRIASHTNTQKAFWTATLNMKTAPEIITFAQHVLYLPKF
jgi:hypothetical protein